MDMAGGAVQAYPRRMIGVDEYVHFRGRGYLIVRGLVAPGEVRELLDHVDDPRARSCAARLSWPGG
jgi:hypothetical protein